MLKSFIWRLQWVFKVAKIANDKYLNDNQAVLDILKVYENTPLADHARAYLDWLGRAEYTTTEFDGNNIKITFHGV